MQIKFKSLFQVTEHNFSSLQHNILHSFCCVFVLWNLFCNNQLFICDVIVIIRKSSTGNELWVFIVWGWLSICDVIIFNICHKLYINCLWALSSKKKGECGKFKLPQRTLILNMRGLLEEIPFMTNCGITLERGNNETWGRLMLLFWNLMLKFTCLDICLDWDEVSKILLYFWCEPIFDLFLNIYRRFLCRLLYKP